tara:strand:- start:98 stop:493 length:396 start_codon:yes stop_codon:yes gene_type:complete
MWIIIGVAVILLIIAYIKNTGSVDYTKDTLRGSFDQWKLMSNGELSNKECLFRTLVHRKNSSPMLLPWDEYEDNGGNKFENRLNELENMGLINYSDIDQLLYASSLIIYGYENKIFSEAYFDSIINKLENY